MSEHTPTPWEACGKWVCEENDPGHNVGICVCEDRATEAEALANAAFIVKAVNNHDALVEMLKEASLQIEYLQEKLPIPTSSGVTVLVRINHVLASVSGSGSDANG